MVNMQITSSPRPAWVQRALDEIADPRLQKLVEFAAVATKRRDIAMLEKAVESIAQSIPHSYASWALVLEAAALQDDVGLQRAACERLYVIARDRGDDEARAYYLALDEHLIDLVGEPTYRLDQSYTSCEWIEGGVSYSVRSLKTCCIPNRGDHGGWEPIAEYDPATRPPLLAFVRTKQRMRHAAQSGGIESCRGCVKLQESVWRSRRTLVDTLNLAHHQRCNLRCDYCYLEQDDHVRNEKAIKDPNSIVGHLRYWSDSGLMASGGTVYWGGGEPVLLPEFDELIGQLVGHRMANVVNTNGVRYSLALERALRHAGQMAVCSIDAGTRETFKRKKKVDALDKVITNCARYVASRGEGRFALKYLMDFDNQGEADIRGFIGHALDIGVAEVVLDVNHHVSIATEGFVRAIAVLAHELTRNGVWAFLAGCGVFSYGELDLATRVEQEMRALGATDDQVALCLKAPPREGPPRRAE